MKSFITGSGQLGGDRPGFMESLKNIKMVRRFGQFCQYSLAVAKLSRFMSPFFQRLPGANIETNFKDARASLETANLEVDELIVSLNFKSLYTNVLVGDTIENLLEELYSSNEVPEIRRSALKSLLRLAITNVYFKCNKIWYIQSDGLAMGNSLAVISAILWIKSVEKSLQKPYERRRTKLLTWVALVVNA